MRHSVGKDYDINKFINEEQLFIKVDANEMKKLQAVFHEVCCGLNASKYIITFCISLFRPFACFCILILHDFSSLFS
jgi:hypothetical protein